MAKQLNLLSKGQVITTALHTEMQRSHLEYAMSVIVGQCARWIKARSPAHCVRYELGLVPDRPYRKCARVVGDVLGNTIPRRPGGLRRLGAASAGLSSRYPLLAGHGNFGSVDNDPPAAMRYTETRLAAISHEAMLEIGEETVGIYWQF